MQTSSTSSPVDHTQSVPPDWFRFDVCGCIIQGVVPPHPPSMPREKEDKETCEVVEGEGEGGGGEGTHGSMESLDSIVREGNENIETELKQMITHYRKAIVSYHIYLSLR